MSAFQTPAISSIFTNIGANGEMPDLPTIPDVAQDSSQDVPSIGGLNGVSQSTNPKMVDFGGLVQSFRDTAPALDRANKAEKNFLAGHGNLMEMTLERVKADTLLSLDSAFASRTAQSASTLMNLQV